MKFSYLFFYFWMIPLFLLDSLFDSFLLTSLLLTLLSAVDFSDTCDEEKTSSADSVSETSDDSNVSDTKLSFSVFSASVF